MKYLIINFSIFVLLFVEMIFGIILLNVLNFFFNVTTRKEKRDLFFNCNDQSNLNKGKAGEGDCIRC